MTDDQGFERALQSAVREGAPELAPSTLRDRVEASLSTAAVASSRPIGRPLWLATSAAAAVLVVAILVWPRLVLPPGATPASSSAPTALGSAMASERAAVATPLVTTAALPEPIVHPGFIQAGNLLTQTDGYAVNVDGRLLLTHSAGAAWRDATPQGALTDQMAPFFIDPVHGWISWFDADGMYVWRTSDAGVTWQHALVPGLRASNWSLVFLTPDLGWLATDPGAERPKPELRWTTDGGATWSDPIDLAAATGIPTLQDLTFVNHGLGFMSGEELFRRTTDGGRTWTDVDPTTRLASLTPNPLVFRFSAPTFFDAEHGLMEVGIRKDLTPVADLVYATDDGGATWNLVLHDDVHRSWLFVDADTWIALDGTRVWTTTDAGKTIDESPSTGLPVPLQSAYGTFVDPMHAWVSASEACPPGIFCSIRVQQLYGTSDGGQRWTPVGDCVEKGLFPCSWPRPT